MRITVWLKENRKKLHERSLQHSSVLAQRQKINALQNGSVTGSLRH